MLDFMGFLVVLLFCFLQKFPYFLVPSLPLQSNSSKLRGCLWGYSPQQGSPHSHQNKTKENNKKNKKQLATSGMCIFLQSCIISTIIVMECHKCGTFAKWENGNKIIFKCHTFHKSIFLNRRLSWIQCYCILYHFSEHELPSNFQAFINIFGKWKSWQLSMFLYFSLL